MTRTRLGMLMGAVFVCCFTFVLLYAGDQTTLKGFITGRTGDNMTVRTADGTTTSVLLTDDTKVQEPEGVFRHKHLSMAALIPGLAVSVKGTNNNQGQFVAKSVSFSKGDLKNANEIQAGLTPTEQQVQGNTQSIATNQQQIQGVKQRFSELSDYEVKDTAVVYFAPGSDAISPQYKAQLSKLASNSTNLKGYIIQVKGYCDSTGNPAQNQVLSRDRAEAVVAYLEQNSNIPIRHIVAPGAMSTADPAASNETQQGRAENRRVEVKVLVNRGIAGN
jgi:OmpA-OmpF porin, OOP family